MTMANGRRLAGGMPQWVVDLGVAALCFFVLYDAIASFEKSIALYQTVLTQQLLAVVALMSLPLLLLGVRPLASRGDGRAWLAILGVMLVSTVLAEQGESYEKLRLMFACLAFGLALRVWLEQAGERAVPAVLFAICLVHVLILMLVIQKAPSANPLQPYEQGWVPYHSHIRHVAYHGMVAACAGVALGFLHPALRLPGLLLAAMAMGGTFYFGARGALLGWLVFVAVFAVASRKPRAVLLIAALAAAAGIALAMLLEAQGVRPPFTGTLHGRVESVSTLVNTTGRTQIWTEALRASVAHPWFGYGMDGYRVSGCCMRGTVQPHNTLIQWLIEFGLIGTAVVLWGLWRIVGRRLLRAVRERDTRPDLAALLSITTGFLAFGLVDGLFYHVIPLLLFSILCALLYRTSAAEANDAPSAEHDAPA